MRFNTASAALVLAIAPGLAVPAAAQVLHPAKATGVKTFFVPAYQQCSLPTLTHQPTLAVPACPAAVPVGTGVNVAFGATGYCDAKFMIMNRHGVSLTAHCSGIIDQATNLAFNGSLTLTGNVRTTDTRCSDPGTCTAADTSLEDVALGVTLSCTASGTCSGATDLSAAFPVGGTTEIAFMDPVIFQPDGVTPFAVGGLYLPGNGLTGPHPRRALRIVPSLISAYDACPATSPPPSHDPPLAVPACEPAVVSSSGAHALHFGPHGKCTLTLQAPASGTAPPDITVKVDCRDVRDATDAPLSNTTLQLIPTVRLTDNRCTFFAGPCTLLDMMFPVNVPCGTTVPLVSPGRCHVKTLFNFVLPGSLGDSTVLGISDVRLVDADANRFAVPGGFVP